MAEYGWRGRAPAPEQAGELTGAEAGRVSRVSPGLKTIIDARVIDAETVFGRTGNLNSTLRISPQAVVTITQAQVFDYTEPKDKVRS